MTVFENGLVSVIIPTRNRAERLARCVQSVLSSSYGHLEIFIVDDASTNPVDTSWGGGREVRVIRNQHRQFLSASRNRAARQSRGEYLFFLDDDNVVDTRTIEELTNVLRRSDDTAVVSPVMYFYSEPTRIWTSYVTRSSLPAVYHVRTHELIGEVSSASFHNAFMLRRNIFEELGGFDSCNFPMHFSEIDMAERLRNRGYRISVAPTANVWHDIGPARTHVDDWRSFYTLRNRIVLLRKHESRARLILYALALLPPLYLYYTVRHTLAMPSSKLLAPVQLLRGVIDGFTTVIDARTQKPPEEV